MTTINTSLQELNDDRRREWGLYLVNDDARGHSHEGVTNKWAKDFSVAFSDVLHRAMQLCPSIAMDNNVLSGTPRIAGTRVPIYMVIDAVKFYGTVNGALTSYPQLTIDQVREALSFAAQVL